MSKIIRNIGGNHVQDPSAIAALEYSKSAGSQKVSEVGRHLLPIPYINSGAVAYTTDASGTAGVQTITTVADVAGSLAGTYFLLQAQDGNKYAMWFKVSGVGSAPVVAGYTASEVDINTGASAANVGTALKNAINLLNSGLDFSASGTSTVTVTNKQIGSFTQASDGTSPTGFTFAGFVNGTGTARVLPNAGLNLAVYNNSGTMQTITTGRDNSVAPQAAGVTDANGRVGIPCTPNSYTYIACDSDNWVVSNSANLMIFIIDDETSVKVEASR